MRFSFDSDRQNKLAEKFHSLHHTGKTLVLPNVWDCTSAKVFEESGFQAIATTSSGISWSCGYRDGEHIPPELMTDVIGRIAHSVNVPVTADIEGGYFRNEIERFSQFISTVIEAGAVGINLEDGYAHTARLNEIAHHAELIKAAKETGRRKGVNLFVNARTDAMILPVALSEKIKISVERAAAYEAAGADGVFVPFIREQKTVAQLKKAIRLPLNILINDSLNISEVDSMKVNRISVGGRPAMAVANLLGKIAKELKEGTDWHSLFIKEPSYDVLNGWFK